MSLSNLEAFAKPATRELPKDPHEEFSRAYPKETVWVYTSDFGFAIKMRDVLKQYGYLTPGQLAAVHRCMDSEASYKERQAIRGCTPEQTKIMLDRQVGGVDLTKVPSGLNAVPGGDTRLKVKIQRGTGRWQGWIFVTDGAVYGEQRKYGAQRPGYTYDGQIQPQLRTIAPIRARHRRPMASSQAPAAYAVGTWRMKRAWRGASGPSGRRSRAGKG